MTRAVAMLTRAGVFAACALAALALPAFAQGPVKPAVPAAAAAAPVPAAQYQPAPVVVFNREIIVFKVPFYTVSPEERAAGAQERIRRILAEAGAPEPSVEPAPQGAVVKLGGRFAFAVLTEDADVQQAESAVAAAERAAERLREVVQETRESRDVRALLTSLLYTAVATVLFAAFVWGLHRLTRRLAQMSRRVADTQAERLRLGGAALVERDSVMRFLRRVLHTVFWALVALAAYEWLGFVLGQFPYTRPWSLRLTEFLLETGSGIAHGMARAVPGLVVAVAILFIARGILGLINGFFDRVHSGAVEVAWLDRDLVRPMRRVVAIIVWLFALVMAYPYLPGSGSEAFKGVSVLVGLMVSIGGASIVGQGAAGLILMYTRTLRAGEYVRIGDNEGTIIEVGMFSTRIRTGRGEELTVPSSLAIGSVTRNFSRAVKGRGFVLSAAVTIGYDTPWRQVHAMLEEAGRRTPGVLGDPAPRVFQTALGDFYPEYQLVCHAVPEGATARAEVLTLLHQNIQDVFNEYGVQIMSPHYFADPQDAKIVPPARWYEAPARAPGRGGEAPQR